MKSFTRYRPFFAGLTVLVIFAATGAREAGAVPIILDQANNYVATIEPGATISHQRSGGKGPLIFTGMQMALGPAETAVFPAFTSCGSFNGCRPRELVSNTPTFTLLITGSGNLYEGFMTWWADAGEGLPTNAHQDGTPPEPGNASFASTAFEIYRVVPEPTSLALIGLGLAGLGWSRRKKI